MIKRHWHCWDRFIRIGSDKAKNLLNENCSHHRQIDCSDAETLFMVDMEKCHICYKERQYSASNKIRNRKVKTCNECKDEEYEE